MDSQVFSILRNYRREEEMEVQTDRSVGTAWKGLYGASFSQKSAGLQKLILESIVKDERSTGTLRIAQVYNI